MQLFADRDLLRADGFALAAAAALIGAFGLLHVLPFKAQTAFVGILGKVVHHFEVLRDIHAERAGHTILAVCAADERAGLDHGAHLGHHLHVLLRKPAGLCEGFQVVRHLRLVGHTGEDDLAALQALDPAHRPGGNGPVRARLPEAPADVLAQRRQAAALDRLHDDHRDAAPLGQLVALQARLNVGVHVVELNLAEIPVAIGQHLLEQLVAVVEGEAEMADAALLLLLEQEVDQAVFKRRLPVLLVDAVQQVKVEVLHLQGPELTLEDLLRLLQGMDERQRQLGGQVEALARIPLERAADEFFAGPVVVEIGRVKVIDAGPVRGIEHRHRARFVDCSLRRGRKAHAAKAQTGRPDAELFQIDVFHKVFLPHSCLWLYHSTRQTTLQAARAISCA